MESTHVMFARAMGPANWLRKSIAFTRIVDRGQTLGAGVAVHGLGGDESGERSVAQGVANPEHKAVGSQQGPS